MFEFELSHWGDGPKWWGVGGGKSGVLGIVWFDGYWVMGGFWSEVCGSYYSRSEYMELKTIVEKWMIKRIKKMTARNLISRPENEAWLNSD